MNDALQINVSLKLGAVSQKVEVQADATMVQTQQNMVSQVMDQQRVVELPLNGRDPTQLIIISGGAVNHSDGTNTGNKSFYTSQSISIAGSAGNTTNYLLDGGDNMDSFTNVNMPLPFPDAMAEFSVETSVLPARNGLHPGGLVNVVTKSGSNDWHGDVFEFVRNGDVNALNYFAVAQDSLKRNQFGGTFGGHIIRDKLFFFGGIQETIVRQDPSGSSAFIPTTAALERRFQFAGRRRLPVQRRGAHDQRSADRGAARSDRLHQSSAIRSGSRCLHEISARFFGDCLRPNSLRSSGDL